MKVVAHSKQEFNQWILTQVRNLFFDFEYEIKGRFQWLWIFEKQSKKIEKELVKIGFQWSARNEAYYYKPPYRIFRNK